MDAVQIIGAGGIGCAIGYALLKTGVRVVYIERNVGKIDHGRQHGVLIHGQSPLPADFIHIDDWEPRPGEPIWLCTKCYDNAGILARLPTGSDCIPVQNGFDTQLDARPHPWEGIASFVAQCEPDRPVTRITRPGELHLGGRSSQAAAFPQIQLSDTLFRTRIVPSILPYKYAKLMYNAAISPLAAAAGVDNGVLLSHPPTRHLFFTLLQENYSILSQSGIELGKVGPFHPGTVARILRRRWLARVMARFFEPSLRGTYCSMAGEIATGRTELENYNGHLLQLAGTTIPCPVNRAVYDRVLAMQEQRAQPDRAIWDDLATSLLG